MVFEIDGLPIFKLKLPVPRVLIVTENVAPLQLLDRSAIDVSTRNGHTFAVFHAMVVNIDWIDGNMFILDHTGSVYRITTR